MIRVAFYSFGCKLNQCESEALMSAFWHRGFFVVPAGESADLAVVNSCTVTSMAEQKVRRCIRSLLRQVPAPVVAVTGCYAQLNAAELEGLGSSVVVTGMEGKSRLMDLPMALAALPSAVTAGELQTLVRDFLASPAPAAATHRFRFQTDAGSPRSRAFVKIQDGCNHRCSYCRIPLARGPSQSLPFDSVRAQLHDVLEAGFKEVVLTGINLSEWSDPSADSPMGLAELVLRAADWCLSAGGRLRLSSLEPDRLTGPLLHALLHPAVTPHLHLALQSMSPSVLRRMNRFYDPEGVLRWIEGYRSAKGNPFLAADLIAGFDGESDAEFETTLSVMETLRFAHLHVFPFSKREGTPSFHPQSPVSERVRDERAGRLRLLSEQGEGAYWEAAKGQSVRFLIEGIESDPEGGVKLYGISENYLQGWVRLSKEEFCRRKALMPPLLRRSLVPAVVAGKGRFKLTEG